MEERHPGNTQHQAGEIPRPVLDYATPSQYVGPPGVDGRLVVAILTGLAALYLLVSFIVVKLG